MRFKITTIEFDFSLDYGELIGEEQEVIYDEVLGKIWEADDEDDLVEKITESTGWCIKSIDYRHVNSNRAKTWTDDFSVLVEKYAKFVMDGMDYKTIEQFVFDTLVANYNEYSEEELINEIREHYDDEVLESFGVKIIETPDY